MEAPRSDIVEFIRFGLQFDELPLSAIVAWADSVIAAEESPPAWAIDLAMASKEDVSDIARQIPLASRSEEPCRMLLGYLAVRWQRRHLSLGQVATRWRDIYYGPSEFERLLNGGPHVDGYFEEFVSGWYSRRRMESTVDQSPLRFLSDVEKLPSCFR